MCRAGLLALLAATLALGPGARLPGAPRCPVFPPDNPWNRRVDGLPVAKGSAAIVASIGADRGLHADFGSGLYDGSPIGIPITVVRSAQPKVRVSFDYAGESDRGPYPIPPGVRIEGGSDRHTLGRVPGSAFEVVDASRLRPRSH